MFVSSGETLAMGVGSAGGAATATQPATLVTRSGGDLEQLVEPQFFSDVLAGATKKLREVKTEQKLQENNSAAVNNNPVSQNKNDRIEAPKPVASGKKLVVRRGKSLGAMLGEICTVEEAKQASTAISKVYNTKQIKEGTVIDAKFMADDHSGALLHKISFSPDPMTRVDVVRQADGDFKAESNKRDVKNQQIVREGKIKSSLFASTQALGIPSDITNKFIKVFSYDVDFQRDLQPGDSFAVIYDAMVNEAGEKAKTGRMLYASLTIDKKKMEVFGRVLPDGSVEYRGADGKTIEKALLRTPVDGAHITSGFGMRVHPLFGYSKMHKGVDFGAPVGTPVYAAGNGVVEEAGWQGSYGRYVRIRHNSEFSTAYAHLNRFAEGLKQGDSVKQGEIIAYVGSTGNSTGPHLHYEVLKKGSQINPTQATIMLEKAGMDKKEMASFQQMVKDRRAMLVAGADKQATRPQLAEKQ
ncbi:MAG: peptidoglycan DD-metalloendopeptidase family protein [Alphaproteobacteria bacterium]